MSEDRKKMQCDRCWRILSDADGKLCSRCMELLGFRRVAESVSAPEVLTVVSGLAQSLPSYQTAGAGGADVRAALWCLVPPGGRVAVPTGLEMAIPVGYAIMVLPRSGVALNHGVTIANSPGLIDSDYRGELKILLVNHGKEPFQVHPGDRIAQLVLIACPQAKFVQVDFLVQTPRGSGGFGSTGKS